MKILQPQECPTAHVARRPPSKLTPRSAFEGCEQERLNTPACIFVQGSLARLPLVLNSGSS